MPETQEQLLDTALVTLDDLKSELGGVDGTAMDNRLKRLINACTIAAERYMRRALRSRAFDVRVNGTGTRYLEPASITHPITAVELIWVDQAPQAGGILIQDDNPGADPLNFDVVVPAGRRGLVRSIMWPRDVGNVRLKLTAGYDDAHTDPAVWLPDDVRLGAFITCREWWRMPNRQDQGITSVSAVGQTIAYRNAKIPPEARELWDPYIRHAVTS
jgi:hypothetical protein